MDDGAALMVLPDPTEEDEECSPISERRDIEGSLVVVESAEGDLPGSSERVPEPSEETPAISDDVFGDCPGADVEVEGRNGGEGGPPSGIRRLSSSSACSHTNCAWGRS